MTATCTHCESTFRNVDRNEDGSPAIENTRCANPGCDVYLCRAGCEHFSFQCEGCHKRFCSEHKVTFDGFQFCPACAIAEVEAHEPECDCRQTDVDLFDAQGCEFHDPASPWNVRLRTLRAIQQYDQDREDDSREALKR
jgi:hypothetical protein